MRKAPVLSSQPVVVSNDAVPPFVVLAKQATTYLSPARPHASNPMLTFLAQEATTDTTQVTAHVSGHFAAGVTLSASREAR
jgi:hypothetical protein